MAAIVSRAQWGATRPIPAGRHVPLTQRRGVTIHWPASNTTGDPANQVRAIERAHLGQGWAIIGYNFLVASRPGGPGDGLIFEGCGRDIRGIHSPPTNTTNFGICILQQMNTPPSQAALNSTRALYNWLTQICGRQLTMSWHGREFATACPGPQLIAWTRAGMPTTNPTQDWFDMATEQQLEAVVRRVLNEGTVQGQTTWAATNRAIAGLAQNTFNRLNEIAGQLANLARRIDSLGQ